jgi:hypothetical protein
VLELGIAIAAFGAGVCLLGFAHLKEDRAFYSLAIAVGLAILFVGLAFSQTFN